MSKFQVHTSVPRGEAHRGAAQNHAHTPLVLTDANFDREVLEAKEPVLVDFWAPWCGPCRAVGPVIDALATQYAGKAKVAKLDVDNNRVAGRFGVRSIPTVILFANGAVKNQWVGVHPQRVYEQGLQESLSSTSG